ncbi:hypothetical protein CYMTET_27243 [Cymbomonas tetramitiformis]|uniref:Uncharacterized protein n=1 Tax=Cymbomonas tetramitiformis TaxID=36881 RepID=A0AAE0KXE2_9CHLO|nr:hypothetical protein CYMTET_27243 [Cymbomonas tetramitiformis]
MEAERDALTAQFADMPASSSQNASSLEQRLAQAQAEAKDAAALRLKVDKCKECLKVQEQGERLSKFAEAEAAKKALEAALREESTALQAKLEAEAAALTGSLTEATASAEKALKASLAKLEAERDALAADAAALGTRSAADSASLEELRAAAAADAERLAALQRARRRPDAEVAQRGEALAALGASEASLKEQLAAALADAEATKAALNAKGGDYKALLDKLQQAQFDASALKEYNTKISTDLAVSAKEIEDLKARLDRAAAEAVEAAAAHVRRDTRYAIQHIRHARDGFRATS